MSNEQKPSSGGDGSNSASGESKVEGQSYSKEFVDKLLKEKKNYAGRVSELESKLKADEESKMEQNKQYKELADTLRKENGDLKQKIDGFSKMSEQAKKIGAVRSHLQKFGLKPEYEELALNKLLDVSGVVIDSDSGAVLRAEETAKSFHQEYSKLGIFGEKVPGTRFDAPSHSTNQVTRDYSKMSVKELQEEYKKLSK